MIMFLVVCILPAGDIHMNLGPPIMQNIRLATRYARSVHNKSASITDLVIAKKWYILDLTDTWLHLDTQYTATSTFNYILASFDLIQHVSLCTHIHGH